MILTRLGQEGQVPSHSYCTNEKTDARINWVVLLSHPPALKDSSVLIPPLPFYRGTQDYISVLMEPSSGSGSQGRKEKRSDPSCTATLPQGDEQRAESSRPGDFQSLKGQRSPGHTPPTTTAGAIFNRRSLLGPFLHDLPGLAAHCYLSPRVGPVTPKLQVR